MAQGKGAASDRLSVEAAHYYARIYAAARAGCLAALRRAGCSEEEAEDIFAATLERMMRKLDPINSPYVPAQTVALLKKACLQKLIDERRHRDVLRLVPLQDASRHADGDAASPPEAAEEREAVAIGREAISSLPERDRALFFQRHQLNLTPEEILRRNPGLSRRTYRKIMQRANARALAAFEEIGNGARCGQMQGAHLRRYVAGEASEEELAMVRAHLGHCRACQLWTAQMKAQLHDVASSLAAVLAIDFASKGLIGGCLARLSGVFGQGGQALIEASRAARERMRELALRIATALPGSGGDVVGQAAGISGVKAVSACAAGAIAAGCLAAGVLPGLDASIGANRHPRARVTPSIPTPPVSSTERASGTSAPEGQEVPASSAAAVSGAAANEKKLTRLTQRRRPEAANPARPTTSGSQTAAEFGVEAAQAGSPEPSPAPESSSGNARLSHGAGTTRPSEAGSSTGDGSAAASEFGL